MEIPDTVTEIEKAAFKRCRNLRSVDIPDSVTSIGSMEFKNCINLVITVSKNCRIGEDAFTGCKKVIYR